MSLKRNILFTIPNFKTAGSQYVMLAILRSLPKDRFEVFVGVASFPELIPDDIPFANRIQISFKDSLVGSIISFRKIIRQHNIHIVHSWDYKSSYTEALACFFSSATYLYTKKNNAWSKRWLLKSILSKHIVYDNPCMKERFFSGFFLNRKTAFIPHGVDVTVFKPALKKATGIFKICCVGNINENKNQLYILQAMTKLPEEVQLHLYGREDSEYKSLLEVFIAENKLEDRVFFYGYVSNTELPKVLSHHHAFVLASKNEGFPVCLLEAMACGLPVLSSDSGGGASYLLENNKGGFVFELNDGSELIEYLSRLIKDTDLYLEMSKAAVENVNGRFSLEKETLSYENLYLRL